MVAIAAGALSASAAAALQTKTVIYQAFSASGKPAIHVTSTVKGSCFSGSSEADRNNAWRCSVGNFLYDPCFSSAAAPVIVLCPKHAWSRSGIEIQLKKALPTQFGNKKKPSTKGTPWAMRTTSGLKCVFQGMGPFVSKNVFADYACAGGTWLWNQPNRKQQPWTIKSGAKTPTQTVQVKTAWF
jgi:eukaryotic-like serine/threonine-protein kinase